MAGHLQGILRVPRYYRRNLPHFRIDGTPCAYFVTWRLAGQQLPLSADERSIVVDALLHFHQQRYDLLSFVVMDDHVHVVVVMARGYTLERVLHSWKSFTAHQLVRAGARVAPLWQDESFDRVLRDDAELREKLDYIAGNPWKRWPNLETYEWLWTGSESALMG
ncbi:MAG TPA: transposase [Vicinamibacterales bacterium]|mgnify:CR=1 FL=1|nr:transposase [Gemmatimonadales bacterium]HOC18072.1 transposase [Vicinamibacterales bacterium]